MSDPKALMKEGEECLKTSWLKWEVDHIAAAALFEQAGRIYQAKGDEESAYGAFLKAAKSHLSKGGKGYEAAAAAYQMAGQAYPERATDMYNKSVELYMANGNAEDALQVIARAAESAERAGNLDMALVLYAKAADLVHIDEMTRAVVVQQLWTILNTAFRKLIQGRKLAEASKCANKMLAIQKVRKEKSPKMILQIIILYLARGDIGAARQLLASSMDDAAFFRSNEGEASQLLIEAYEKLDGPAIQKLVEGTPIKYLDNQVVYLARELNPETRPAGATPAKPSTADSSLNPAKAALFSTSKPSPAPAPAPTASAAKQAAPIPGPSNPMSVPIKAAPTPVPVPAPAPPQPVAVEMNDDLDLPDIR